MNDSALEAAARGATLVTPNKRLAREIIAQHDTAQRVAGRKAWVAARALPWRRFVIEFWQAALDAGLALPPRQLDATQAAHLWRHIVEADLAARPLVDVDATAELAGDAWELVHAHGAGGDSWRGFTGAGEDVDAFVRWAGAFVSETGRLDALDLPRAADWLARNAAVLPGVASLDVAFCGFVESTPQQRRLADALTTAGAKVALIDAGAAVKLAPSARLVVAASIRDELVRALDWARARALADPEARVGIVVPDLAARRAEVRALADDLLCPALQWPDALDRPRPYDLSAGESLASVPLVAAALSLVALAHGSLDVADAALLVRSPSLPDGEARFPRRAALERRWREEGTHELALPAIVAALDRDGDPLARRWAVLTSRMRVPSRASPRSWADTWRAWLDAAGWPHGRALGSAEFQARGAWDEVLAEFVRLGAVSPQLARDDALAALRRATAGRLFQPESAGARIEILGMLEAGGLAFDALWVCGLTAEAWPAAAQPHPLLPIAWQRERGVPHSHAGRELDYARRLTAQLSRAAPEVEFSYPSRIDDHPQTPSPLIAALAASTLEDPSVAGTARAMFEVRGELDRLPDTLAPPVAAGAHLRGGAGLVDAQSACPFKAVAIHRLAAREWPAGGAGLTPIEQGAIVHATLAAFWREVRDHATLVAMDDAGLDAAIARAVAIGRHALEASRWSSLPPVVAASEDRHVAALVRQWLVDVERTRGPFDVIETEARREVSLAGMTLDVTLDRIDRLPGGASAIVDYKTGRAVAPAKWFGERPEAPQLALYVLAHAQSGGAAPAVLAYGEVRPGAARAVGIAGDAMAWPALDDAARATGGLAADWPAALAALERKVVALGESIRAGDATVTPRDAKACRYCHVQPVCRIRAVRDLSADPTPEDASDG
jgi:probable DNA repair protein